MKNKPEHELIELRELFSKRKQFTYQTSNNIIKNLKRNEFAMFV